MVSKEKELVRIFPRSENDTRFQSQDMSMQTMRLSLAWKDLTYSASTGKETSHILKGVSGFANPGELLAIMGSSGSGKTSLVSILSNQLIPHKNVKITGKVLVNDQDISKIDYSSFSKYVMQQDILLPTLTPREALFYSSKLKLQGSNKIIEEKVNFLLNDLKLTKCADNLIGNETIKGLSGGEKKRVCIGIELISEPVIFILDEPTSGLDSFTAELVISLLKVQANKGKTIIFTIHQPSTSIFQMFDRLILMTEGHFIYQGTAQKSMKYFEKINFKCLEHTNPPDHYIRTIHIKHRKSFTDQEQKTFDLLIATYKKSEKKALSLVNTENLSTINSKSRPFRPGFVRELQVLTARCFKNTTRNPLLFFVKMFQAVTIGVIIDILFHDLGYDDKGVNNRKGLIFFSVINLIMFGANANSMTFPIERPVFLKDYKEGLYGVWAYVLSKFFAELPVQVMFMIVYIVMFYFAVDFNMTSAKEFFIHLATSFVIHLNGCALGNFAGSISKDVQASTVYSSTIVAPLMMFGGFFSRSSSLSGAFYWIKYISPFSFGFEALAINEFQTLDIGSGVTDPLQGLGYYGEVWESVGGLLLIELGATLLVLCSLKYFGESAKSK